METDKNRYTLTEEDKNWIHNQDYFPQTSNDNANAIVSGNDSCKRTQSFTLTTDKVITLESLYSYNYRTPTYKITNDLEKLFEECQSNQSHWAYIAEAYSTKTINSVLRYMSKRYDNWSTLQNPAAYFTSSIKFHKKRKRFRNNNDSS